MTYATPRDEGKTVAARIHQLMRTDMACATIAENIAQEFAHAPETYEPIWRQARELLSYEGRESALLWTSDRAAAPPSAIMAERFLLPT